MGGLFEDIGRTNTLGNASQTFLENAMRLRQQGNAEREAEAVNLRQNELLKMQQAQEERAKRVADMEFVEKQRKAEEYDRERPATESIFYKQLLAQDASLAKEWLDSQVAEGVAKVGADGVPMMSQRGRDIFLNQSEAAKKVGANMLELRISAIDMKLAKAQDQKLEAELRGDTEKAAELQKYIDNGVTQKILLDQSKAKLVATPDKGSSTGYTTRVEVPGAEAAAPKAPVGAGGSAKPYGWLNGEQVFIDSSGEQFVRRMGDDGNPARFTIDPSLMGKVVKEPSSMSSVLNSFVNKRQGQGLSREEALLEGSRLLLDSARSINVSPNMTVDPEGNQFQSITITYQDGTAVQDWVRVPTGGGAIPLGKNRPAPTGGANAPSAPTTPSSPAPKQGKAPRFAQDGRPMLHTVTPPNEQQMTKGEIGKDTKDWTEAVVAGKSALSQTKSIIKEKGAVWFGKQVGAIDKWLKEGASVLSIPQDPETSALYAAVADIYSREGKMRSGANFTAAEMKRLDAILAEPSNHPTEFISKLQRYENTLDSIIRARHSALRNEPQDRYHLERVFPDSFTAPRGYATPKTKGAYLADIDPMGVPHYYDPATGKTYPAPKLNAGGKR